MDTEVLAALLGAFVGAVAGGAASFAGSVVVSRLQLRREMRIHMYDELLPQLIDERFANAEGGVFSFLSDEIPAEFIRAVKEVERARVIAGPTDAVKAKELDRLVRNRSGSTSQT
jgi:hypothetical protein